MGTPRALQLSPPYGTSLVMYQPTPGSPLTAMLMYDSESEGAVIEWLRETLHNHEATLVQQAKALYAEQKAAAPVVEPTAEPPLLICEHCGMPGPRPRTCCRKGREADSARSL